MFYAGIVMQLMVLSANARTHTGAAAPDLHQPGSINAKPAGKETKEGAI